ncbi:MAG: Cof-type HAD-IIB family hydrolase [Oscillospiraceae bacterium]|nr:Cof-type HAD-IIB family hydrolase [Oscillospiraceae bacterium]
MIKLIASDMDGTLLNDEKELPPDFFLILDRLCSENIHFVIASGRSFSSLKINFEGHLDKLDFICDNGAYVVVNGELVSMSILDKSSLREMLEVCRSLKETTPVLCGVHGTYFERTSDEFFNEVSRFYLNYTCVDDIRTVDDDIFKVAVCDTLNPQNNSYPVISGKFGESFTVAVTGPKWIDIMNRGINKGAALKSIQCELNIPRSETMTFGDYFNDTELLLAADYGFVMENAHPDMFSFGKYRAKSNNDFGVTKAIREYVLNEKAKD